ncbi:MAG: NAD-dependent epimerase/dehydratase family protein [Acidimicrobiales bacterium]
MKVFVAGATGALGKQLVPLLVAKGHEVVGMTRTDAKADQLRSVGARPVVADALDADGVGRAIGEAEPDVIVHQLTAIPPKINMRRFEREFALTNRLRTEGTDHLLSAGRAAGVKRFVAQSNASLYARTGGPIKREDDPLDDDPPPEMRQGLGALRHLEAAVTGAQWTEGLVLRYGWFYGPGTSIALDPLGSQIELLRKRQLPIVGGGKGVWSFIHIEDAAAATVAAVEGGPAGIYNVVDDEPAPVSEWAPVLETYFGEWLPEPVVTGGPDDPATHAEISDSLSLAFLVLLERLSPEQRAVFLLREVFDYGYDAIAEIVGKSEAACRQLAVRARRHVEQERPRFEASRQEQDELARRFMTATQTGDLDGLEALRAHDVALHGDGGGKVRAIAHRCSGAVGWRGRC